MVGKKDLHGLLATARDGFLSDRQRCICDVFRVAASTGGAEQFAEVLGWVIEHDVRIDVATYHKILTDLIFRVPTPVAMVRVALNLTIQRPADIVPLIPSGFGDEPQKSELFQGCCPLEEVSKDDPECVDRACTALRDVALEDLLGRVELADSAIGFAEYYSHFLPILHIEFLEELRQQHWVWQRPASFLAASGSAALRLQPEPSEDGKLLILQGATASIAKLDVTTGSALLLAKHGVNVMHGGAICFGQVVYCRDQEAAFGLTVVALDVGRKDMVKQICQQNEMLDAFAAVNVLAYQRQLAALTNLAQKKAGNRFPLWQLLPLSGVGGDIVDPWASKIRGKLQKAGTSKNGNFGERGPAAPVKSDVGVLKLLSLGEENPAPSGGECYLSPSPELTLAQQQAVQAALGRRLTVIQGPPGTGKTHVSVEVLRLWTHMGVRPILVASHNNVAVDNVAESAYSKGLSVVRIAKSDRISSALDNCSLDSLVASRLGYDADKSARHLESQRIVKSADVVCVTTTASATSLLRKVKFGAILMDEAAQTTELSALVPLTHLCADRLVLVGDHCQLPATALSLEAETRGSTLSLFQRLVLTGFPSYFLDTQFRMHSRIAEHSSVAFYDSKLLTGIPGSLRPPPSGFDWPCPSEGVAFIDTGRAPNCSEEKNRLSWCNPGEAVLITQILASVLEAGELKPSQIGVVTPYMGQVRTLRRLIRKYVSDNPEMMRDLLVASVDSFQGREKDLILVSSVRCNRGGRVGFLADWRRLNVTLTRARRGIIVVGNRWTLRADPYWRAYVDWTEREGFAMDFNMPKVAVA